MPLSTSQFEWWLTYSMSRWVESTGIDLDYEYIGPTTAGCLTSYDDENSVVASPVCFDAGCTVLGLTDMIVDGSGDPSEADVCIFAGAWAPWGVQVGNIGATTMDFPSVVTHEFGHVLGLDHTDDDVMDPA